MEKSIQLKAKNAFERREAYLKWCGLKNEVEIVFLWTIHKKKDWISLGFDSFKDYFVAPVRSGGLGQEESKYVWAIQQIAVYDTFVVKRGMTPKQIAECGIRKLYSLRKEEELSNEEIINKCLSNTLRDIQLEQKKISETTCKHENVQIMYRCQDCQTWFNYDPREK